MIKLQKTMTRRNPINIKEKKREKEMKERNNKNILPTQFLFKRNGILSKGYYL